MAITSYLQIGPPGSVSVGVIDVLQLPHFQVALMKTKSIDAVKFVISFL